jgi:hypothetical protein
MPPKPHRALIERVTGYADEASAYLRRRRETRRPFARVTAPGGRTLDCPPETEAGRQLFRAAAGVIDAARGA